jgi:hypothetical protein
MGMGQRGNFNVATILGIVVAVVLLIAVAVPVTITTLGGVTSLTYVVREANQSIVANNTNVTLLHFPVDLTTATFTAEVNGSAGKSFTLTGGGTNYTLVPDADGLDGNGTVYLNNINATVAQNGTLFTYAWQGTGYDESSSDRTVLNILPLALAVIVLIVVFSLVGQAGNFA